MLVLAGAGRWRPVAAATCCWQMPAVCSEEDKNVCVVPNLQVPRETRSCFPGGARWWQVSIHMCTTRMYGIHDNIYVTYGVHAFVFRTCRYPEDQPFPSVEGSFTKQFQVVDADWTVVINAPSGGVKGAVVAPRPLVGKNTSQAYDIVPAMHDLESLAIWGNCRDAKTSSFAVCREVRDAAALRL